MFHEQETLTATRSRLTAHAQETNVKPPVHLFSDGGAPSEEVRAYCNRHGLTLDWVYLGAEPKFRQPQSARA